MAAEELPADAGENDQRILEQPALNERALDGADLFVECRDCGGRLADGSERVGQPVFPVERGRRGGLDAEGLEARGFI